VALAIALVAVSLVLILIAAEVFTNAVEWFGHRLHLAQGAVGSVLAAVGTALPETMIPIIAILVIGSEDAHEIGVGAILGAPFLLSTAAFAVTGLGVLAFASRRTNGTEVHLDAQVIRRDLGYFFVVYLFAIGSSFLPVDEAKYVVAVVLLGLYALYVQRTFAHVEAPVAAAHAGGGSTSLPDAAGHSAASGHADAAAVEEEEELNPLRFHRLIGGTGAPPTGLIVFQLLAALGLIIGGAQLFVTNLEIVAEDLGVPALALALIIAPLATELPEKFNSIIWVSQGKDTLAMGNITGAMVFQSCIPVAVGVTFTEWELTTTALISAVIALGSSGIVYLSIMRRGYLSAHILARAGFLWLVFVTYVVAKIIIDGGGSTPAH
jgi:cation:H+ antiporter